MAEKKRNILYIVALAFVFLFSGMLVGCGGKKETIILSSGSGSVSESVNAVGDKVYTATADKWNDFLGWYNENVLFSEDEVIILDGDEPEKLTAVFATNAQQALDRLCQSMFNKLQPQESEYFNFASSCYLAVKSDDLDKKYSLQIFDPTHLQLCN